ncbi:MAG TPA: arylsulfatase [Terriglobales bacterium]|nr:arylsulfatase [Terriglobales bacterium]
MRSPGRRLGISGVWGRVACVTLALACATANAQTAATDVQSFKGKLARDPRESLPAWPEIVKAPAGAPNVVLILVDDVGFSTTSTFGGPVPTPNFEKLAARGLKYNTFHVDSICSASRAALLSGRNSHQMGFGTIAEHAQGYPGYNSYWPASSASIAKVLTKNGYNTAAFGKWHNTPVWEMNPGGPYDRWPTGLGFEYFYGFLAAFDSQYTPRLYRNTTAVEPGTTAVQGYDLTNDMTNDAIRWLHRQNAAAPDKPFFLYFATAGTHTPHHVPAEWIEKFRGKFDQGWDKLREENFEREKKLVVIPPDAKDNPRPEGLAAWDSLPPDEKKLLARQAEVYAGFTAYTDYQIGRLLDAIAEEGLSDNTLVIEIFGDNGGSAEDGPTGYDTRQINGQLKDLTSRLEIEDELGSELFMNATAAPWAWAFSAPFPGTKVDSSHLGGTRDPMVIAWPKRIKDVGGLRSQFGHLTDIAPTIYEAANIQPPAAIDGVKQTPLEGASLGFTFDQPKAESRHRVQLFETNGNKGIYKDGWWAGNLLRPSWYRIGSPGYEPAKILADNTHPWELYNLNQDFSQATDVAAKYPEKLAEMKALFEKEGWRTQVFPLLPLRQLISRPEDERTTFVFRDGVERFGGIMNVKAGATTGYTLTAQIENPDGNARGVLFAQGGRYGGITLYVQDGRVHFEINSFSNPSGELVSKTTLPTGKSTIVVEVTPRPKTATKGSAPFPGTGTLTINGTQEASVEFANIPPSGGYWSPAESLDVGSDLGSAVSNRYQVPNRFTGKIDSVKLQLHKPKTENSRVRNDDHS